MLIGDHIDGHLVGTRERQNNETVILILIDRLGGSGCHALGSTRGVEVGPNGTQGTPAQMVMIRIISELTRIKDAASLS